MFTSPFLPPYELYYVVPATLLQACLVAWPTRYSLPKCLLLALLVNVSSGLIGYGICSLALPRMGYTDRINPNPFGTLLASLLVTCALALCLSALQWVFLTRRRPFKTVALACAAQLLTLPLAGWWILRPEHPYRALEEVVTQNRREYLVERISDATFQLAAQRTRPESPPLIVRSLFDLEPNLNLHSDPQLQASLYLPSYSRYATGEDHKRPLDLTFHDIAWKGVMEMSSSASGVYLVVRESSNKAPIMELTSDVVWFSAIASMSAKRGTRSGL